MHRSPPSRGRGSKLEKSTVQSTGRPLTGARIETAQMSRPQSRMSPPSRGRGSKRRVASASSAATRSPPSRGRGSKHPHRRRELRRQSGRPPHGGADRNMLGRSGVGQTVVAPLTGARIETLRRAPQIAAGARGRPPHGGADRNAIAAGAWLDRLGVAPLTGARIETPSRQADRRRDAWSPPSRGRGSKPATIGDIAAPSVVAPLTGARIETYAARSLAAIRHGRPLTGARIETIVRRAGASGRDVAPLTGARIETLRLASA